MKPIGNRKIFNRLNQMLDDAIDGNFCEQDYDESELSKLEVKWKRYLTSSKLSAKKIEDERTAIKELVTDISHQTKTPLANILLYAQLLEERSLDEQTMKMVEEIHRQSEKLDFLIQSLVKTSRLESGTFRLYPEKQNVEPIIKEVIELAAAKAEKKGIAIESEEVSAQAVFDPKWTKEALFNIVDNAIKYSPCDSLITIKVLNYEMFLSIQVRDQGIGIEEEEIPKIFGRFYRSKNVRTDEGVGIGLYLTRQIIESQGGYIKVTSTPGSGSKFQIFLPKS